MKWLRAGSRPEAWQRNAAADVQLLERLRQLDKEAFLEMYESNCGSVYRFLINMTGSISAAEELTQEVFVLMLDALVNGKFDRFDPQIGSIEGYLLGVARNLARKDFRRKLKILSLDDALSSLENEQILRRFGDGGNILSDFVERSELKRLQAAILQLPEHYREAVVLCSLQEKSYRDAAQILACSEGTVASRLNLAKGLLSEMMKSSVALHAAVESPQGGER